MAKDQNKPAGPQPVNDQAAGDEHSHDKAAEASLAEALGLSDDGTIDTGGGGSDARDVRIAELEEQVAQLKDQALRALADSENLRRRTDREKEQWRKFASADLAKDLLNAVDNLRRALDAVPENRENLDDALKNVIVGVEMTEKEVLTAFEKHQIKRIDPLGDKFDYNLHQAMFEVEDPTKAPGTVVQVLAPGYVLHDRLLRAAMVGVAKGGKPDDHERVDTTA
ncbi:MAG: nucleotide exchange factor GrpE [Alphaproteobacteria bacterium]|nr:nucleotide exchange factor GrpE [Alphaproteobacteria bacterium]